jgi:hypothetical protein
MTNDCKTAVPEKAKAIYPTAIAATIFAVYCSLLPAWGFFLLFLSIPFAFFWMLFQLVYAIRHAEARRHCLLRAGVWLFAFALVFGINAFRDWSMRHRAEAVIAKIEAYRAKNGTCPPTPAAIGENLKPQADVWGTRVVYYCVEGKPILFYSMPPFVFDKHFYDFEHKTWIYMPD